ncbi:spermidine hydroxycinnamoyl transferase [Lactuca sativa]|uniref:spermidine hydroxycinnamoyl transferase n=1 Tax=Lactuca sativa TaxID=4236 RepID=UPI000CD8A1FA|nr:spermidine hydroxycinnamoyl transferase [Lactuca sativa]
MKVSNKTSCMVRPAEPTWSGKLALSELDQTGVTTHVPTIYFYAQSPEDWVTVIQTLKTSLSCTLVHFYPLAGRLSAIAGGRLELNCNAAGAQFTEAYTDKKLIDLDSLLPSPIYHQLIPSIDYQSSLLEEIPLLVLQVTRFVCGGFSLGVNISHVVADGQSALHFVSEWARISRGELLESPPYLDRKLLRAGEPPRAISRSEHAEFDPPPILIDQSGNEKESEKETAVTMLKLTATQVEKLRRKADNGQKSDTSRGFTRYETVTAHIWRTACKARNHKPEQPTALAICIDVRSKMRPPLPRKYFGNGIVNAIATGFSGEIVSKPLGYVSCKIREVIEKVDDGYVHSVLDFLKSQQDLSLFRELQPTSNGEEHFYGNPNLGVISWLTLPIYGADFGWGKEIHMGPGTHDSDGDSLILHGKDGDGSLVIALCLQMRHMEDFRKVFYQDIDVE